MGCVVVLRPRSSFSLPPFHFYFYFRCDSTLPFSFIIYQFLLLSRSLVSCNLIQVPCLYFLSYSGNCHSVSLHLCLVTSYYIPRLSFIVTHFFIVLVFWSLSTSSFSLSFSPHCYVPYFSGYARGKCTME